MSSFHRQYFQKDDEFTLRTLFNIVYFSRLNKEKNPLRENMIMLYQNY